MVISSGESALPGSDGLMYAPFGLDAYLRDQNDSLDTECFDVMPLIGDEEKVYEARNRVDRNTVLGVCVRHWAY